MIYVHLSADIVDDVLYDNDSKFPIESRFPKSYLDSCMKAEDDTDVKAGYRYAGSSFTQDSTPVVTPVFERVLTADEKIDQLQRSNEIFQQGILAMMEV